MIIFKVKRYQKSLIQCDACKEILKVRSKYVYVSFKPYRYEVHKRVCLKCLPTYLKTKEEVDR